MRRMRFSALVCTIAVVLTLAFAVSSDAAVKAQLSISGNTESGTYYGAVAFKEAVERESGGQIVVEIFPNGQLGSEQAGFEAQTMNALDFNTGAASVLALFVPGTDVFGMPFLFENKAQAYEILDGPVAAEIFKAAEAHSIKVLASWENGFRQVGTIKKPIHKLEDLKGLKIRTAPGDIFINTWACLGASATPIAWNEVFTALQTGVVDGQEVPLGPFYTGGFGEVVKYYSFINYMYDPFIFSVSMSFWNKLTPEQQKAVQVVAEESRDAQRAFTSKLEEEAMTALVEKEGMTFIEIDDLKPFQDAVRPVLEKYQHKDNLKKVLAALGRE